MSHGKCEPTNTNAADYKLYARFDAGETLESVLASPPTTKHNKVTSGRVLVYPLKSLQIQTLLTRQIKRVLNEMYWN
ncbi:TPA: hypothetical protein MYI56_004575 [Klebsiella pneumoniae]|nr:hypothetical protein [Klebsiella pneumoniae]HCB4781006.1 hypothetical protein [Klebsiella pneumoniae]HCB4808167.1 hypothetical protein [Klebsiella pneumoniae]